MGFNRLEDAVHSDKGKMKKNNPTAQVLKKQAAGHQPKKGEKNKKRKRK